MAWCGTSNLNLNVKKTKDMKSNSISIKGEKVKVVEEYKCLGVHLDNRLDWRRSCLQDGTKQALLLEEA